ncbi:LppU/SCO3897 family protein [Glycomyces paridis]|uniref:Uncharacterized protein n=1 Tax=Glycomyces paridis TaxID=2126555 RepID=A0A4S8P8Q9_9ACTN|nr:hypothetical protein [Glycomyces paridis]THV24384.1 hypothetical protein E9998_21415 [Glycomyces paridis]
MDPYASYNPNPGADPNQPNGYPPGQPPAYGTTPDPYGAPDPYASPTGGYAPSPGTSHSIGYPPPGPPAPGPYPGAPAPGPYGPMPPQYGPPVMPQPSSGIPAAGWIGIALGIVLVVGLGIAGVVWGLDRSDGDTGGTGTSATDTDEGGTGADPGTEPTEAAVADPVADAAIGDCFYDYGDETTPDLEATSCGAGTFEAIDIVEGTSDLTSCDDLPLADSAVTSTAADRVLCLSYTAIAGDDAYHAQVDECIYGTSTPDSAWNVIDCQDGAFKVIERLEDESSTSSCTDSTYYIYGLAYTTSQTYLDVTLCLTMIYPGGDAGYAGVDDCMSMNSDYTYFEFVSDCSDGNVYITGRSNEIFDDPEGWCNGWGWHYQEIPDFPELSYTVCWGWL